MTRDCILARIDSAIEKVRAQGVGVRAIYLTERAHNQFDRAMNARWKADHGLKRFKASWLSYGDLQIRRGTKDVIYSEHGVGFTIPKKLSPRVAQAEAA